MKQNSSWSQYLPTLLIQQIRLQWYKDGVEAEWHNAASPF